MAANLIITVDFPASSAAGDVFYGQRGFSVLSTPRKEKRRQSLLKILVGKNVVYNFMRYCGLMPQMF